MVIYGVLPTILKSAQLHLSFSSSPNRENFFFINNRPLVIADLHFRCHSLQTWPAEGLFLHFFEHPGKHLRKVLHSSFIDFYSLALRFADCVSIQCIEKSQADNLKEALRNVCAY